MAAPPRRSDPRSDGELARAAQAGGDGAQSAMAAIYDRFSEPLYGFSASVLRNPTEAADAVQDVFIVAMRRIATLQDPEKLRSWLFSIARYDAMARVRKRARLDDGEVPDVASSDRSPEQLVAADEVASVVWEATLGLNERDRAIIELNVRHGLEGAELAEALAMTPSASYVVLSRAKDQMARAVGALLLARGNRKECEELAALLVGWDGRYSPLIRKRISRHADDCDACSRRSVAVVRALSALAAVPVLSPPTALRAQVLSHLTLVGANGSAAAATAGRAAHLSGSAAQPSASHWSDTSWGADGFPEGDAPQSPLGEPPDADAAAPRSAIRGLRRFAAVGGVVLVLVGGATALVSSRHADGPRTLAITDSTLAPAPTTDATASISAAASSSIEALSTVAAPAPDTPVVTTVPAIVPTTSAPIPAARSTTTTRPRTLAPSTNAAPGSPLRLGSGPTATSRPAGRNPRATTTTRASQRLRPTTTPILTTTIRPTTTIRAMTTVVLTSPTPTPGPAPSTVTTTGEAATSSPQATPSPLSPTTESPATTLPATTSTLVAATTTAPPTTTQPPATTTKPVPSTTSEPTTTTAPSTTATATTAATTTTTTTPFVVVSAEHRPDVIKVVPCQTGPTETVLVVVTNGGAAPYVAKAFLSNGAEVELPSSGPNTFKSTVGGFKSSQIGSYTWLVKVTDANGTTATKVNGSKIVVNPCS